MIKHWIKYVFVSVLSIISICVIILDCLPKDYGNDVLIIDSQYQTNVLFYVEEDKNIMIGSNITLKELDKITRNLRIKQIEKIIAYDLQLNKIDELSAICVNYNVNNVILSSNMEYSAIVDKLPNVEIFNNNYVTCNLTVNLINRGDDIVGIELNKFTTNMLIPLLDNSKSDNNYLLAICDDFDYIVTNDYEFWKDVSIDIIDIPNTDTVFM